MCKTLLESNSREAWGGSGWIALISNADMLANCNTRKTFKVHVQVHFIGSALNHLKNFQRHSPHKTICFGQSKVICFVPNFPQLLCLVMSFVKKPIILKWSILYHLVFIETLWCVWVVYGYDRRAIFLLPNQREDVILGVVFVAAGMDRLQYFGQWQIL